MVGFHEYLVENNILTESQGHTINMKSLEYNTTFYNRLKISELLERETLVRYACSYFGMYMIEDSYTVEVDMETTEKIDSIFQLMPKRTIALRVKKTKESIVLIADPQDSTHITKITDKLSKVSFALASKKVMDSIYNKKIRPVLICKRGEKIVGVLDKRKTAQSEVGASDAKQLYNSLLESAILSRASDLHMIPGNGQATIELRIDGLNRYYTSIPPGALENIKNIICNEGNVQNVKPNEPINGKAAFSCKQSKIDIRFNILPSKFGADINIRFLGGKNLSLEELGMSNRCMGVLKELLKMPKGLVIITGPTGSGKSTTLYGGLHYIRNNENERVRSRTIITAEDPVEITMEGITQLDIHPEQGFSYGKAVAEMLRHDVDVAVVGEIRDLEVASEVIRAANTGHLTLSTLHTNDALGALERFITIGVDTYSVGEVLSAIIAQRLVRRICPHCKKGYLLEKDAAERKMFGIGAEVMELFKGEGCSFCDGSGYLGRLAVNEIIVIDGALRHGIQNKLSRTELEEMLKNQNFQTLLMDAVEKVKRGETTLEEIEPYVSITDRRGFYE